MATESQIASSWTKAPPHPWRRLPARLCDYAIFQTLFGILIYAASSPDFVERLNALRSQAIGFQMFSLFTALLSEFPIALLIARVRTQLSQ